MTERIDELIEIYEGRRDVLDAEIEEIHEMYGEDFDVIDACGANYDEAYSLGHEHGEVFTELESVEGFIYDLNELKELVE